VSQITIQRRGRAGENKQALESTTLVHEGREDNWARPVHRAVIRDARLSWGARGLFIFLWDLPSNWRPRVNHLKDMGVDGREATRSRMKELEALGAIRLELARGLDGKVEGTRWVIVSPARWAQESKLKGL
jgi:hypothetical protein